MITKLFLYFVCSIYFFSFNNFLLLSQNYNKENRTPSNYQIIKNDSSFNTRQKFAVVIGVSEFKYSNKGLKPCKYAKKDAEAIYEFLQSPVGGEFTASNIRFLINENATKNNIKEAIDKFLGKAKKDDIVVLYIAGILASYLNEDGRLFYANYDIDPDRMDSTGIYVEDFILMPIESKNVSIFVDANRSGCIMEFCGRKDMPVLQKMVNYSKFQEKSMLCASSFPQENALEGEQWGGGHGVFTYLLLKGLKGEADDNCYGKKDGIIQFGELIDYLWRSLIKETNNRQHLYVCILDAQKMSAVPFLPQNLKDK